MSTARFAIDRIAVTLHGALPTDVSVRSLEMALIERLGVWRPDVSDAASVHLGNVDLGSVAPAARLDAPMLATIIADRLTDWIDGAITQSQEDV